MGSFNAAYAFGQWPVEVSSLLIFVILALVLWGFRAFPGECIERIEILHTDVS